MRMMQTIEHPARVDDDPGVIEARRKLAEAMQTLEDAETARATLPRSTSGAIMLSFEGLRRDDEIRTAAIAREQSTRILAVAEEMATTRIRTARRPGRLELLRRLRATYVAAHEVAVELREYDEATAAMVGLAPGPHPTPLLLAAGELQAIERLIDPPAEVPRPLVPGTTRVRTLIAFRDISHGHGTRRTIGEVVDLDDADLRVALEHGWVEVV